MHGEVPLILSLLLFYFCTGFIVVLGRVFKLWILCKCFLKSSAQTEQYEEHISALRFNVFWLSGPSPILLQAPSTSRQEWNLLPSSLSPPCACYGLVKVFLSPSGPSLRKGGSLMLPLALLEVHHSNQKCETIELLLLSHKKMRFFLNSLKS